jgi:hypothetical protein
MPLSRRLRHGLAWALVAVSLVFLATGFGITEPRIIETLSLGILTKAVSFRIHSLLWGPFLILLVLHVSLAGARNR